MAPRGWRTTVAPTQGAGGLRVHTVSKGLSGGSFKALIRSSFCSIDDTQISDAGDYECVAENVAGRSTGTTTLIVREPPIIQLDPNESLIRHTEGDEVRITCIASGSPNPTVQWEGQPAVQSLDSRHVGSNTAYLNIYRVTQADAKVYTCTATNEAGTDIRTVRIDVQPKRGDIGECKSSILANTAVDAPYNTASLSLSCS